MRHCEFRQFTVENFVQCHITLKILQKLTAIAANIDPHFKARGIYATVRSLPKKLEQSSLTVLINSERFFTNCTKDNSISRLTFILRYAKLIL